MKIHILTDNKVKKRGFFAEHGLSILIEHKNFNVLFDTDKGLSIFLGCSHPGIINCLIHALALFPGKSIYSLVAGMHLESVTLERLQKTIQYFKDLNIQKIIPLHCTGIFAISEMKRFLGDRCHECGLYVK